MYNHEVLKQSEKMIEPYIKQIDEIEVYNQNKVLNAFIENKVSATDFSYVSGYGHDDMGREKLDRVFASIFKTEKAIVRNHFVSGTHALSCCLLGNLNYGDTLVSVAGSPYDTMEEVIGKRRTSKNSLIANGINYKEIPLINDQTINYDALINTINENTTMVLIQRSCGYQLRESLNIDKIKKIIEIVKIKNPNCICFVDNCYGEFVEKMEPTEVGADIIAGSLIKNPGGGIVETGGYIAGKKQYVINASERLTAPGIGEYGGSMLNQTRLIYQGIFMSPMVVANALKGAILSSCVFEKIGFESYPKYNETRTDIIQKVKFGQEEPLRHFCETIQHLSPIDSYVTPMPDDVPGYDNKLIMAGGSFIEGSTIELSADGPLRPPYVAYMQGGLSYSHVKIALGGILKRLNVKNCV